MSKIIYSDRSLFCINSTDNTFIIDKTAFLKNLSNKQTTNFWTKEKIIDICKKQKVDGLTIIFFEKNYNLRWQFFNSDGSLADMCGNLVRALIYFLSKNLDKKIEKFSIIGPKDIVQKAYFKNNIIFVSMPKIKKITTNNLLNLNSIYKKDTLKNTDLHYVDSGVPHALIPIYLKELDLPKEFVSFFNGNVKIKNLNYTINKFSKIMQNRINKIRYQTKKGFNITLFNPKNLQTISFERGVEDFTLSCGTGACAVAYYLKNNLLNYKNAKDIKIKMPGGDLLINVEKKTYLLGGNCRIIDTQGI